MIRIRVIPSAGLRRLTGEAVPRLRRAGRLAALRVAEEYVDAIHDQIRAGRTFTPRTGRLGQSIGWRASGNGALVFAQAPYAGFIERGTRPHLIRPRPGRQALRFFGPAGPIIRRVVRHPGTTAQPFFYAEWETRRPRLLAAARAAFAEALL